MSRDLADENYYVSQGKDAIPVKWTAPEAIHYKKYSTASDVWAYGCLLYEIWSVGHKPFERLTNPKVHIFMSSYIYITMIYRSSYDNIVILLQSIQLVDSGRRLPPPPACPKTIYQLMIQCWCVDCWHIKKFTQIVLTLDLFRYLYHCLSTLVI